MPTLEVQRPLRLLLVEDTLDDERLALRALRTSGLPLAVRVARDGHRARRALGLGEARDGGRPGPDLVVSDLKLPGLDGRELLCLVRNDERLSRVPFMIFSSSNESSDVRRCLECGADAFVQKPVGYEEYLDCLHAVVRWAFDGFAPRGRPSCVLATPDLCASARRAA